MWVAIEATTLVSAFLVSFKFTRSALEATWKYVMVCTVGICLALFGNNDPVLCADFGTWGLKRL